MGYRNLPIIMTTKQNDKGWSLELSVVSVGEDFRHTSPILREILTEFLYGKFLVTDGRSFIQKPLGEALIYSKEKASVYKIDKNELFSEAFLSRWCYLLENLVYDAERLEEIENSKPLCHIFISSCPDDWDILFTDKCFFSCTQAEEKTIRQLEGIIKRAAKNAERNIIVGEVPYNYSFYDADIPKAWCSHAIDYEIGYRKNPKLPIEEKDFWLFPLYLFKNENKLHLATSPDCRYAGLNRLFDGIFLKEMSRCFDASFVLDGETQKIAEFAGITEHAYRDENKLVIRKLDDFMYCDFFKTRTVETLWYEKGEFSDKKTNPRFRLTFSPNGLNSNLIATFELFSEESEKAITNALKNACRRSERELILNTPVAIKKFKNLVLVSPRSNEDIYKEPAFKKKRKLERLKELFFQVLAVLICFLIVVLIAWIFGF